MLLPTPTRAQGPSPPTRDQLVQKRPPSGKKRKPRVETRGQATALLVVSFNQKSASFQPRYHGKSAKIVYAREIARPAAPRRVNDRAFIGNEPCVARARPAGRAPRVAVRWVPVFLTILWRGPAPIERNANISATNSVGPGLGLRRQA